MVRKIADAAKAFSNIGHHPGYEVTDQDARGALQFTLGVLVLLDEYARRLE